MAGARITVCPDNRPEKVIRKSLWRQWSIIIALLVWAMWFDTDHYNKSVLVPVAVTLAGVVAGWLFGYKLGFGPVFSSSYIFSAERVIEPTEKPRKAVCLQCNSGNCEVRNTGNAHIECNCPDCGYNARSFTGSAKI